MEDLQDHLSQVHGTDEMPDSVKESVEGEIKTRSKSRL